MASNLRVDQITASTTGSVSIGTATFTGGLSGSITGLNVTGVITATTLNQNVTGVVTATGGFVVGTGATISGSTNTITASTNGSERVRIDSTGRILQGTTSYKSNLNSSADGGGQLAQFVGKADNTNHCLGIFAYSGTSNPTARGAKLQLHRARSTDGTTNTPVAVNDLIGSIEFKGNDATSFTSSARIDAYVDSGTVDTDRVPGNLRFYTSADAVGVPQERLRITSGGDVQIANGNLVFSTSGTGIDFSATSDGPGTTTSELLDDYEEGTYTPTITLGFTNVTYSTRFGRYTKIGRMVYVQFRIQVTDGNRTATSSNIRISLPFAVSLDGDNYAVLEGYGTISNNAENAVFICFQGESFTAFYNRNTSAYGAVSGNDVGTTGTFDILYGGWYYV